MSCPLPLPDAFEGSCRRLRMQWARCFGTALPGANDWREFETRCWRIDLARARVGHDGGLRRAVRL